MPRPRHYLRAPITEAILDIRVELPDGVTVANLEAVRAGLEDAYPTKKHHPVGVVEAQFGRAISAAPSSALVRVTLLRSG